MCITIIIQSLPEIFGKIIGCLHTQGLSAIFDVSCRVGKVAQGNVTDLHEFIKFIRFSPDNLIDLNYLVKTYLLIS